MDGWLSCVILREVWLAECPVKIVSSTASWTTTCRKDDAEAEIVMRHGDTGRIPSFRTA